ncbi:MAG TPA: DUF45 domain-containing protein [Anaerolineae bacterium]|nr:DUF45 domain-containing protein [Anaerolineae bacterium]
MRPFRVRESARARHVRLRLSLDEGLVVVVPRGFDTRRLPQMVAAKEAWIERAWARLTARDVRQGQSAARKAPSRELPRSILLSAVNETWTVSYGRTSATTVTVRQGARRRLTVSGKTSSAPLVRAGLKRWLLRRAHEVLEPWLARLAREGGYRYERVLIKCQRTRWGSCSSRKTISLSLKLLFLKPELVEYVLWHELCHTRQPNHSGAFWALVSQHEPRYALRRRQVRAAARMVPRWVD